MAEAPPTSLTPETPVIIASRLSFPIDLLRPQRQARREDPLTRNTRTQCNSPNSALTLPQL